MHEAERVNCGAKSERATASAVIFVFFLSLAAVCLCRRFWTKQSEVSSTDKKTPMDQLWIFFWSPTVAVDDLNQREQVVSVDEATQGSMECFFFNYYF